MGAQRICAYECDTCKRSVERTNDGKHPDPLRCVITKKCRGKLTLVSSRKGSQPKLTPPVLGLDDWFSRDKTPDQAVKRPLDPPASIASFDDPGGLTAACLRRNVVSSLANFFVTDSDGNNFSIERLPLAFQQPLNATITVVLYELTPTVLEYRHYMFTFNGVASVVSGQDSSPDRRLMRFASTSLLRVYANGVELSSGEFDRTTDDVITLTPELNDSLIIVDVYVYKDTSSAFNEADAIRLNFAPLSQTKKSDLALRNACSWGNVLTVITPDGPDHLEGVTRLPLFCHDVSALDDTKTYGVARFEATLPVGGYDAVSFDSYPYDQDSDTRTLDASQLYVLLASPPYSFNDKRLYRTVLGSTLVNGGVLFFNVNETTGQRELSIAESSVLKAYEPLIVTKRINTPVPLSNPASRETTPVRRTLLVPQRYIIGPS